MRFPHIKNHLQCHQHHRQKVSNTSNILANALGSATAGIVGRLTTHPLDTAKARLQSTTTQQQKYKGPIDVLYQTFRTEGIRGLYRGFSTVIVGGTPGTIIYLCSYDIFKDNISSFLSGNNNNNKITIQGKAKKVLSYIF